MASAGAQMAGQGAAIIDVGGESTRPGAKAVWEGDEIERIAPVIRQLAGGGAAVSVDTRKADVMSTTFRRSLTTTARRACSPPPAFRSC